MRVTVVLFSPIVEMEMSVSFGIMRVDVQMELLDSKGAPQNAGAEND